MEFTLEKSALVPALALAKAVSDTHSKTLPILAHVIVRAADGRVTVSATDLTTTIVIEREAEVRKPGAVALHATTIHEVVKGLTDGDVSVTALDRDRTEIRGAAARFKLAGLSPDDFPKLPDAAGVAFASVDAALVRDMIDRVAFAACTDDQRPYLAGVYFQARANVGRMVATDGHRLSKVERSWNGGPTCEAGVIILRKGVADIRRLLSGVEGTCEIGLDDKRIYVRAEGATLSVTLADGQFPPYEQVIPKRPSKSVIAKRAELLDAIRRTSLITNGNGVGIRLDVHRGRLRVAAEHAELGDAEEEIAVGYDGPALTIGFNPKFLVEPLDAMEGEDVLVELSGELDPMVIRAAPTDEDVGVVMPMRM